MADIIPHLVNVPNSPYWYYPGRNLFYEYENGEYDVFDNITVQVVPGKDLTDMGPPDSVRFIKKLITQGYSVPAYFDKYMVKEPPVGYKNASGTRYWYLITSEFKYYFLEHWGNVYFKLTDVSLSGFADMFAEEGYTLPEELRSHLPVKPDEHSYNIPNTPYWWIHITLDGEYSYAKWNGTKYEKMLISAPKFAQIIRDLGQEVPYRIENAFR